MSKKKIPCGGFYLGPGFNIEDGNTLTGGQLSYVISMRTN